MSTLTTRRRAGCASATRRRRSREQESDGVEDDESHTDEQEEVERAWLEEQEAAGGGDGRERALPVKAERIKEYFNLPSELDLYAVSRGKRLDRVDTRRPHADRAGGSILDEIERVRHLRSLAPRRGERLRTVFFFAPANTAAAAAASNSSASALPRRRGGEARPRRHRLAALLERPVVVGARPNASSVRSPNRGTARRPRRRGGRRRRGPTAARLRAARLPRRHRAVLLAHQQPAVGLRGERRRAVGGGAALLEQRAAVDEGKVGVGAGEDEAKLEEEHEVGQRAVRQVHRRPCFSAATTTNAPLSSSRPLASSAVGVVRHIDHRDEHEIERPPSSAPYARDVTAATAHASSSAVGLAPGRPSSLHLAASAAGGATTGCSSSRRRRDCASPASLGHSSSASSSSVHSAAGPPSAANPPPPAASQRTAPAATRRPGAPRAAAAAQSAGTPARGGGVGPQLRDRRRIGASSRISARHAQQLGARLRRLAVCTLRTAAAAGERHRRRDRFGLEPALEAAPASSSGLGGVAGAAGAGAAASRAWGAAQDLPFPSW